MYRQSENNLLNALHMSS